MFNYVDPAGRNFLSNSSVESEFRRTTQSIYERLARRPNSAFTWLEAFGELSAGQVPAPANVDWRAFPLTAATSDKNIDSDRFQFQDEYVEWRVETSGGKLAKVTFTTEFPEYFEAFASIGLAPLTLAIQDVIPGATPTEEDLFGPGFNSSSASGLARAQKFLRRLPGNPWNNGEKGILCLTQQFNTIGALFNLLAECGVPESSGAPTGTCANVGGACGPGRSSDPAVCTLAQTVARAKVGYTLRDPAGVRIMSLKGVWKVNGTVIDINDFANNKSAWVVSRNGRRAVLTNIDGLALNDKALTTGAQISHSLQVGADLLTAADADLPDWARISVETGSRGPT
jgi:hypothetical protein